MLGWARGDGAGRIRAQRYMTTWIGPSFQHLRDTVRAFAALEQTPISIRHLVKHGTRAATPSSLAADTKG